ncbi:hypothetical protein Cpap_1131 [Ruminiclostridium papyrosolvens DSM 2782]|uniref:Uncharacterized protein n=1 Tax=Ruminiclostridium papyrosolvens DSM 2782 TaxID=588581 RepID=F1TEZ8_9FIRM|nr:AC3_0185 family rSAM-modified Cys-rich RiPP [Ruminiclostridium papyrosolvens]EGD46936.1 hypothetical protein Cpap_1131 [Ruminiclostridium papyrosolvens DSM 2782]WES33815.1 AC3_0185 family rSAM-modified Cys-rich RiPP [Ruminiclostridium papyrosolvens DSM 2782]
MKYLFSAKKIKNAQKDVKAYCYSGCTATCALNCATGCRTHCGSGCSGGCQYTSYPT